VRAGNITFKIKYAGTRIVTGFSATEPLSNLNQPEQQRNLAELNNKAREEIEPSAGEQDKASTPTKNSVRSDRARRKQLVGCIFPTI